MSFKLNLEDKMSHKLPLHQRTMNIHVQTFVNFQLFDPLHYIREYTCTGLFLNIIINLKVKSIACLHVYNYKYALLVAAANSGKK